MAPKEFALKKTRRSRRFYVASAAAITCATTLLPNSSLADEGGVSMWLPGAFGSLAAVPQQQSGWAFATTYYHTSVSAGGDVARAREITIGNFPVNLTATVNASLK